LIGRAKAEGGRGGDLRFKHEWAREKSEIRMTNDEFLSWMETDRLDEEVKLFNR
jgi:hypothetical protein